MYPPVGQPICVVTPAIARTAESTHGQAHSEGTSQTLWGHHSSFAQLVDPDEGTELKFVPSNIINGVRCAQIEKSDVEIEIQYWQNAVLCAVMGANPPFEVMKGFLTRIWAKFTIDRILYVRKGMFLVRFDTLQDKLAVEKRGVYFFDSKPMLVKGWNPTMDLHTETIRSLPIWIQLHSLDIKYWGMESLISWASPLKTDKLTKDKQVIRYARLLVEMQIDGPFPEYIEFFNEEGVLTRQQVTYKWIPSKCTHCTMLGHTEAVCKKKGVVRKEWIRIEKPVDKSIQSREHPNNNLIPQQARVASPITHPPPNTGSSQVNQVISPKPKESPPQQKSPDAFITISRGASPKHLLTVSVDSPAFHHNSFSALNENHILDVLQDRLPLWDTLHQISLSVQSAWCILGDFNTILYEDDRIGGNEVTDHDTQELSAFMETCEMQEMTGSGPVYTWTNKTIWSKIDSVFINCLWHEEFDFTMVKAIPPGLLDHSPLLLHFHAPPRPPSQFHYCDMWSSHKNFHDMVTASLPNISSYNIMRQTKHFLAQMRRLLSQLSRDHFKDLKNQQAIARIHKE
ncbi:hypothetical protein Cgig2_021120 [Carnegiea gigantea]|uniref:DUF4283 domain-containing protein n=1 Tax=Carnegiea gigantea TaxID=171969 RepID=A0A9Q1JWG4_9CARY|nr:hypothetical protein Cgig2_021120 [Carnegiea gigantea]